MVFSTSTHAHTHFLKARSLVNSIAGRPQGRQGEGWHGSPGNTLAFPIFRFTGIGTVFASNQNTQLCFMCDLAAVCCAVCSHLVTFS